MSKNFKLKNSGDIEVESRIGINKLREALWLEIKYILLDMDGTLLDKHFDDYFWCHLVPEKYAEKHNITFDSAKDELFRKYKVHERTLTWTDIDFWTQELNLDIPALKEQMKHLIDVHPFAEDFLKALKRAGKQVFLVTNAHYKTLELKLKKTLLGKYFDRVINSFDMGIPKEHIQFWERAEKTLRFEKDKTLFIDDTEEVLRTAKKFGIKYVALKTGANSREEREAKSTNSFYTIKYFNDLLLKA